MKQDNDAHCSGWSRVSILRLSFQFDTAAFVAAQHQPSGKALSALKPSDGLLKGIFLREIGEDEYSRQMTNQGYFESICYEF